MESIFLLYFCVYMYCLAPRQSETDLSISCSSRVSDDRYGCINFIQQLQLIEITSRDEIFTEDFIGTICLTKLITDTCVATFTFAIYFLRLDVPFYLHVGWLQSGEMTWSAPWHQAVSQ